MEADDIAAVLNKNISRCQERQRDAGPWNCGQATLRVCDARDARACCSEDELWLARDILQYIVAPRTCPPPCGGLSSLVVHFLRDPLSVNAGELTTLVLLWVDFGPRGWSAVCIDGFSLWSWSVPPTSPSSTADRSSHTSVGILLLGQAPADLKSKWRLSTSADSPGFKVVKFGFHYSVSHPSWEGWMGGRVCREWVMTSRLYV